LLTRKRSNAEIKDLFAAGADVVQIDEPWMQQHPDKARRYGVKALDRALDGVNGTVAVHLCFGYAAVVHDKPSGYSFVPELEQSKAYPSKPRSPGSISKSCGNCRRRPSCSASSILPI
jgi:methionine synthase II (cobalamin-independent)